MYRFFYKLFLLIAFLFLSSSDLLAQVNWTKYPGNPVLTGQPGTWYAYTTMNSVLYNADSSRYEMWFTAGAQIGYPYTIGFAWSSDGISWNVYSANPVLTPTPGEWDAYMVLAPYVLRENGQYKMWYSGCETSAVFQSIGYATSPDGINWTKHPSNPVLEPGHSSWESAAVAYPCIMPYSSGYKMWYGGYSANLSVSALGYATSPDGITWEKYTGNPVLQPGASGQWDHVVFGPRVLFTDNTYYMFFTGETVVYQSDKIGLATSTDGLAWTKYPSNPVLKPTPGQWDGSRTSLGSVLLDADTLKMYYCGLNGSNMQLGLATCPYLPNALFGTYTIGSGGHFPTINSAFTKLSSDGIRGSVTLELIDELYTAPTTQYGFQLNGPIPGAGPNGRVTIKPAENKNVVLEGNGLRVMCLLNTSYLTIDGVGLNGSTTMTFHALHNASYSLNDCLDLLYDSDHNIVQNITFISEDVYRNGTSLWLNSSTSAAPDNNLIYNNFHKKGAAIWILGNGAIRPDGNIIRSNFIGSESDSLISWGIQVERCKNTIVENNIVQNIKTMNTVGEQIILGINSCAGFGDIIRNNVVHNLSASSGWSSVGILLSGLSGGPYGNKCMAYNNMVYDIQSSSTNIASHISGIQIINQTDPKIYYNTVYLSGSGNNHQGSAAFYVYNAYGNSTGIDIKNNIFINTRDEGQYCASAIYDYSSANLTSDYNDLYYDDTNQYNCLVRAGGTDYLTLSDWQLQGKDQHSYVEMPHFVEPYLHVDKTIATFLESRGTPVAGINKDYDGDTRNASTPDIGADEFDGIAIVGVDGEGTVPTEYALLQNYPNPFNPGTKISWQSPVGSQQTLKVYDILGNEVAALVDEYRTAGRYEVEFSASALPSGVYFYQLKVTPDGGQAGDFVQTRKMILIK